MEASEPKWVNPVLTTIGVNSLKLGGLRLQIVIKTSKFKKELGNNFIKHNGELLI